MISLLRLTTVLLVSVTKVNSFDWQESMGVRMAANCDWSGGDIRKVQVIVGDCAGKCIQISECTSFTWTTPNRSIVIGTCCLKSGDNSESNVIPTNNRTLLAICGYKNSALTSANKTQVSVAQAPTAQPAATVAPDPNLQSSSEWESSVVPTKATHSSESVFEKNPWLMWALIGSTLIGTFTFCCAYRPYMIAKRNRKKMEDKKKRERKAQIEGNKQPKQLDVANLSIGPPKPI